MRALCCSGVVARESDPSCSLALQRSPSSESSGAVGATENHTHSHRLCKLQVKLHSIVNNVFWDGMPFYVDEEAWNK